MAPPARPLSGERRFRVKTFSFDLTVGIGSTPVRIRSVTITPASRLQP